MTEDGRRTLEDIEYGETAAVASYLEIGAARRFMALGLVPGAIVTAMRPAPLGDPVEYAVKGSRLSMRSSDASKIVVS